MRLGYLCALLTLRSSLVHCRKTVPELFNVNFDRSADNAGGCGAVGRNTLEKIFDEALDASVTGTDATEDYNKGYKHATSLIDAWFAEDNKVAGSVISTIRSMYQANVDWLNNGGPTNNGLSTEKPLLFCSDSWLQLQSDDDYLRQPDGSFAYKNDENGQKVQIRIRDYHPMIQARNQLQDGFHQEHLNDPSIPEKTAAIYYSPNIAEYNLREKKPICDGALGMVLETQSNRDIMTLCPKSFENMVSIYTSAGKLRPKPLAAGFTGTDQSIIDVLPSSITFLHELFHLIHGKQGISTGKEEMYSVNQMLEASSASAVRNPETYAEVAFAYYLTLLHGPDANGNWLTFATGYATQG